MIDITKELTPTQKLLLHVARLYNMKEFTPPLTRIVNKSWIEYTAFPGVKGLSFVSDALSQPLRNVKHGFLATDPVPVPITTGRNKIYATVNKEGMFIATYKKHGHFHLLLYNLFTNVHKRVGPFQQMIQPVAFNDQLILLVQKSSYILVANIHDVLKIPLPSVFTKKESINSFNSVDSSRVDETGIIHFIDNEKNIVSLDLNDFSQRVEIQKKATNILNTTGVFIPYIDCVFQGEDWKLGSLQSGGNISWIMDTNTHAFTTIPSMIKIQDLTKGLTFIHPDMVILNGKTFKMNYPFTPCGIQSIVRLYRDVFLVFDGLDMRWKCLRMRIL